MIRVIRIKYKRITDGKNVWWVDAEVHPGVVTLTAIHGDVTDLTGLRDALRALMQQRSRYARVYGGPF